MTRAQHEPTEPAGSTHPVPTIEAATAKGTASPSYRGEPVVARNDVILRGRVAAPVDERQLPSGDTIITARLIVDRDAVALSRSSQRVDTIDCVAWLRKAQRSMRGWQAGEHVEVSGAIRRRFFRGATGPVSRVEVEIRSTRRLDKPRRRAKPE